MRPQVLSYLLVAVTTAAWLRGPRDRRAPWWLVPLTWVWAMCHGMWPVGIVIGVVAVVGLALDRRATRAPRWPGWLAVPVASALVSLLTPVGPGLFGAVLQVSSRGRVLLRVGDPGLHRGPTAWRCSACSRSPLVPRVRRGKIAVVRPRPDRPGRRWAVYSLRTVPVAAAWPPRSRPPRCSRAWARARRSRAPSGSRSSGAFVAALAVLAVLVPQTADRAAAQTPTGWTRRSARCRRAPSCSTRRSSAAT